MNTSSYADVHSYHTATTRRTINNRSSKQHILYQTSYKLCSHFLNVINGFCINSHASKMFQCSSCNLSWNAGCSCGSSRPHLYCTWLSHGSTSVHMHCQQCNSATSLTCTTVIKNFRIKKIQCNKRNKSSIPSSSQIRRKC